MDQLVVGQFCNTVGYIGIAAAADSEELVRREVCHIYAPVFYINDRMRRMLNGIADDIDVWVDLLCTARDLLDIHDISGNVGGSHNA